MIDPPYLPNHHSLASLFLLYKRKVLFACALPLPPVLQMPSNLQGSPSLSPTNSLSKPLLPNSLQSFSPCSTYLSRLYRIRFHHPGHHSTPLAADTICRWILLLAGRRYTLVANLSGPNFLDHWEFWSDDDPTHVRLPAEAQTGFRLLSAPYLITPSLFTWQPQISDANGLRRGPSTI